MKKNIVIFCLIFISIFLLSFNTFTRFLPSLFVKIENELPNEKSLFMSKEIDIL